MHRVICVTMTLGVLDEELVLSKFGESEQRPADLFVDQVIYRSSALRAADASKQRTNNDAISCGVMPVN